MDEVRHVPPVETPAEDGRTAAEEENTKKSRRQIVLPRTTADKEGLRKQIRKRQNKRNKLANVLPEEKLQQMFAEYCNLPNYSYVARTCNVHQTTVTKYARLHNWEERRQAIFASARKNADYTIQKATETSLHMILELKKKLSRKIDSMNIEDIDTKTLVADLERVVKMEQVLMGGTSDRQEHIVTTHEERIRRIRESQMKALNA